MTLFRLTKNFSLICTLVALVFLFSPAHTYAAQNFWDTITSPFKVVGDTLQAIQSLGTNLILLLGLLITGFPFYLAALLGIAYILMAILGLLSAGVFALIKPIILATLSVPVVPGPETIPAVTEAWQFLYGIVSLFFAAILAFIGLATILRFQNYQFQRTLPLLLIIILLINFSGVLVGFVVDMANLITFAFVQPIQTVDFLTGPLTTQAENLLKEIKTIPEKIFVEKQDPITFFASTLIKPILGAYATAIFYLIVILVLLAVPLLFLVRVGMLWILSILAPFAFAAYILPATREWWSRWWKSLIQWAFMGVPMAFFLLIAMKVASTSIVLNISPKEGSFFGDIFISFIQPLFILLFLLVGFTISITFIPAGAQSSVKLAGKMGKYFGSKGVKKIREKIAGSERWQRFMEKQATAKTPELKGWKKVFGLAVKPAWQLRRTVGQMLGPEMVQRMKNNISKTKNEAEKIETPLGLLSKYLSAGNNSERIAYLSVACRKGGVFRKEFESIMQDERTREQVIRAVAMANHIGAVPDAERIARGLLHTEKTNKDRDKMLGKMGFKFTNDEDKEKYNGSYTEKIIREAKGDEIKDFNKSIWSDKDVQNIIHKHWTGEKVGIAGREYHENFLNYFQQTTAEKLKEDPRWYANNNENLHNYLNSSAAHSLGLSLSEEKKESEEIRRLAEEKYRKRLEGKEPGYTWKEVDEMLREKGIVPGSQEAEKFMEKWDWERAEEEWRKKRKEK